MVFIAEYVPNERGAILHKFNLEDQKSKEFASGAQSVSVTANGEHMLAQMNGDWQVIKTSGTDAKGGKRLKVNLQMKLDRSAEWEQIFEEAWRYERDYFYDPNMHGRDWKVVYDRYAPLVPFIKHRSDLTYILDQVNGELSVGHSFVFGGDYPDVERTITGLLGADMIPHRGRWQIQRIYTTENWNPGLSGPLDAPGLKIKEGYYIVGINGKEIKATDNFYKYLDGTSEKQTILHINDQPEFKDHWTEVVEPIRSENSLRQRTWVEDNRRLVDKLSNGRLGYIWVPNTGGGGFVSFNRYYFAQQDKEGAVIDERFNGGGLLDDYMVDLMTRSLRASLTNEVPNGKPMKLPAGILGPKVLLINELAGSGGDFFPWVFRQQNAGKLIGMTTWGGLVKSSTHYALVDGGGLTAPDNAVFDPINNTWIAENKGVAPDIEVRQDAKSLSNGSDPQLERATAELMKQLGTKKEIKAPKFPEPAKGN
jgi:tricorn protease